MAGKVVNSSFVLLSKFVASRQESASKAATSHIRKTLAFIDKNLTQITISHFTRQDLSLLQKFTIPTL